MNSYIPVNVPLFSGSEKKYLNEAIDSGWISSEGPFVQEFESKFSKYVNRKHGIAVSNGSAALDIAIKAIGIKRNDEVIMPSFSIISPALSVIKQGGVPVFVDCRIDTWNIDTSLIEKKITKKTKAIIVVHIYGLPVDMDPIIQLCNKYNLILVEDAAEMHGQTYNGKKCGSFGDISIFSFYPNKLITTGEGGMIVTDDSNLSEKCKSLRNLCFDKERRYIHDDFGWNYRMTNIQAAIGVGQLENIENHIIKKRKIGAEYNKYLRSSDEIILPVSKTEYACNIYWVYGVVIKPNSKNNVNNVMEKLHKAGIGTRHFFYPLNLQPIIMKSYNGIQESCPNSEFLSAHGFYLPSGLGLELNDIKYICDSLNKILRS